MLLHVSRGVRWDSDHVVILTDELEAIAQELVRGDFLARTHIGLDFFDASINRVAAWVIGTRAMIKALLLALLEPTAKLREMERAGDFTGRLAMLEESEDAARRRGVGLLLLAAGSSGRPRVARRRAEVRTRRAQQACMIAVAIPRNSQPDKLAPELHLGGEPAAASRLPVGSPKEEDFHANFHSVAIGRDEIGACAAAFDTAKTPSNGRSTPIARAGRASPRARFRW